MFQHNVNYKKCRILLMLLNRGINVKVFLEIATWSRISRIWNIWSRIWNKIWKHLKRYMGSYIERYMGFPGGVSGNKPGCQCRRCKRSRFPGVRKIPWRRARQPTPVFFLENPMDRRAWQATVHRVTKSQTQLKQLRTQALKDLFKPNF